jgi:hypothetical protein
MIVASLEEVDQFLVPGRFASEGAEDFAARVGEHDQ